MPACRKKAHRTIYLMRHSEAISSDFRTTDDSRWLTAAGRRLAHRAGQALQSQPGIDWLVSSPCCRAVQTAEVVAHALAWRGEVAILDALRSERSPQRALVELEEVHCQTILAVSHEPIVSAISLLLAGRPDGDIGHVFRTAEIRCFSEEGVTWTWRG